MAGLALVGGVLTGTGVAAADDKTFVVQGPLSGFGGRSEATCTDGSHLIGGGYSGTPDFTYAGSPQDFVDINGPSPTCTNTWLVKFHSGKSQAVALCEKD
ncbi:hypothetical protein [Streptomyces flavofungini]|uniref:Secreted protein n=1 Tax=Streptomyces flavofungini TaxID=68200 RepID=A0ABS0X801_9ACTN|nr:hypothetical protein [Streptomyces flavofungini]MBJ3809335.1 hypothetical protein [Streptomyces flavofungini]GHC77655.1 hypothetical protein GCM10010349_58460 [Streptomyces flavofungini]